MANKPTLKQFADNLDPMPAKAEPAPDAAGRLRAFEDEHFGPNTPRHDGMIERGVGSPYTMMKPEAREKYDRLERMVAAERKLVAAREALALAEAAVRDAESEANA